MLELKQVCLSYGKGKVLDRFDFSAREGECCSILGTSGSGKSTLVWLAAGLLKPDSGHINPFASKRASFLFQDDRLLPWSSALENITVLGVEKSRAMAYLTRVGLAGEEAKRPDELSGGMRRRLAIARCFAYGGDLFFLDEPQQGLDLRTAQDILALMAEELKGKTALLITHNPAEALALSGRIVVVNGPPLHILSDRPASSYSSEEELKAQLAGIPK